jgi:hypothetical protein
MKRTRGLFVVGIVSLLAVSSASAGTFKDYVTEATLWNSEESGMLDHILLDASPGDTAVCAASIVGNGEELEKVGIVWGQGDGFGMPNAGNMSELQWVFYFFADPADFSMSAVAAEATPPNQRAVFATPANSDWQTVIGTFLGVFDLRYSEVDVSALHIRTTPGQTHLVVLVPQSTATEFDIRAFVSASRGGTGAVGTTPDYFHRGALLGAEGPGALDVLGEQWSFGAYKVTGTVAAVPGDINGDNSVDGVDYGLFAGCFNGTGNPIAPGCASADMNTDNSVDGVDYGLFAGCFNGTGNPSPCAS